MFRWILVGLVALADLTLIIAFLRASAASRPVKEDDLLGRGLKVTHFHR